MKTIFMSILFLICPTVIFASSDVEVTGEDMLTILKVIGCLFLFLLVPGLIIGIISAGIRTIRGWFDF